jgi:hypothetical protein
LQLFVVRTAAAEQNLCYTKAQKQSCALVKMALNNKRDSILRN